MIFNTAGSGLYSFPVCCEHDEETRNNMQYISYKSRMSQTCYLMKFMDVLLMC